LPLLRVLSAIKVHRVVENITSFYRCTTLPSRDVQPASLSTRGTGALPRCRYLWCAVSLETSLAESRVCASCFARCIVYLRTSRTTNFWLHCYIDAEFEYVRRAHLLRCGGLLKPRQHFVTRTSREETVFRPVVVKNVVRGVVFLDAVAQSQKAPLTFIISVCLATCINTAPTGLSL
jgi:hypothetical protein